MDNLTDKGRAALEAAAARQGFSPDAARAMLDALTAGRGTQAQFSHPELGGMGQWSRSGMLMIGDMFNNGLKARVDALANELAPLAGDPGTFAAPPAGGVRGGSDWWPEGLGAPSSVGGQNDMRYAVFPEARRLAVDRGGKVTLYDTGEHQIGGASQQQGGSQTLTFSSQLGTVSLDALPVVGGKGESSAPKAEAAASPSARVQEDMPASAPGAVPPASTPRAEAPASAPRADAPSPAAAPAARPAQGGTAHGGAASPAAASGGDPLALLERLADLRSKGIISDEEFAAKKAELLARL